MEVVNRLRAEAATFGNEPLLILPGGHAISIFEGYIPLLINFTFEDKAAKGLRKRKVEDKPRPPVYFSALELVRDNKIVLLSGPSGSGKTTFAKHLVFTLHSFGSVKSHPLARNEEDTVFDEAWETDNTWPCYFAVESLESMRELFGNTIPRLIETLSTKQQAIKRILLLVVDSIEHGGEKGRIFVTDLLACIKALDSVKLVLLGQTSIINDWVLSPDVSRYEVLPLLEVQRQQAIIKLTQVTQLQTGIGMGDAAANPSLFALALESSQRGDQCEELLDAWLDVVAPEKRIAEIVITQAFDRVSNNMPYAPQATSPNDAKVASPALSSKVVQELLAARHLVNLPFDTVITLFQANPLGYDAVLRSLLHRTNINGSSGHLVKQLIRDPGTHSRLGALLVSDFTAETSTYRDEVLNHMLKIIVEGTLPVARREQAGRVLSRLGESRDLTALATIPAGHFTIGSENHPNSQPVRRLSVERFKIGLYPVVNRDYSVFVRETGRQWQSSDGLSPERQSAPATDLSWYDARAYCYWLTQRWRSGGKIGAHEYVRLPTEPEWERACRGDQEPADGEGILYCWGAQWKDNAANYEASGLNTTSTVGLFPQGRSPYGCYDMAGQVWEWCTTLWGENMATPSFQYPWRNDGREALDAPGIVRRVLRGGCFSSERFKLSCTYRGSLEPAGFWRGNGFRIVVASDHRNADN